MPDETVLIRVYHTMAITYSDNVKGEVEIIHEEILGFKNSRISPILDFSKFINNTKNHLASMESKIGTNSIDYINISTEIVDAILDRLLSYVSFSDSNTSIDNVSATEMVQIYANKRKNLESAIEVIQTIEKLNMDYAYRIKKYNNVKEYIENKCRETGIDIRTTTQKSLDQLKVIGGFTGEMAKISAGCALELAIKIAIAIAVLFIIMAIIGVK